MHHITLLRCITLLLPLHCIAALRHITSLHCVTLHATGEGLPRKHFLARATDRRRLAWPQLSRGSRVARQAIAISPRGSRVARQAIAISPRGSRVERQAIAISPRGSRTTGPRARRSASGRTCAMRSAPTVTKGLAARTRRRARGCSADSQGRPPLVGSPPPPGFGPGAGNTPSQAPQGGDSWDGCTALALGPSPRHAKARLA